METLWTPGLEGHQERWSPSLWGSHRSQGITERHFAATVTQGPGVSPQPRDKRETQASVLSREGYIGWECFCILALPPQESIPVIKLHSTINIHAQVHVELGNLSKVIGVYSCQFLDHDAVGLLYKTATLGKTEWMV